MLIIDCTIILQVFDILKIHYQSESDIIFAELIFQYDQLFLTVCKSVDDYEKQFKKINTELQSLKSECFFNEIQMI